MLGRLAICAVVVTYNRKEKLKHCLECILEQENIHCDVLIVDNASTDGTGEMLREYFNLDCIYYYNTGTNLGGAGGFEFGIKEAVLRHYELIWIMDDDTWPEKHALSELLKADKELCGEWGFLSSVAYWEDGTYCKANVQKKSLFTYVNSADYQKSVCEIKFASFVSLLIKSEIVKDFGLPIGEYFIWTDDYEYTGRISKTKKGYMVPQSMVVHSMIIHKKADLASENGDRISRYKYLFRNDVHCYRQFGLAGICYLFTKFFYNLVKILFSKSGRKDKARVLVQGYKAGLAFKPEIPKMLC